MEGGGASPSLFVLPHPRQGVGHVGEGGGVNSRCTPHLLAQKKKLAVAAFALIQLAKLNCGFI